MPYRTWATNDVPSAADFNNLFSDPVTADVTGADNATSTTYGDLATSGPQVTLSMVNGQTALVVVSARIDAPASTVEGFMSFAVSGALTLAASDENAARVVATTTVAVAALFERATVITATSTATATITAKYRVTSGTFSFRSRRIIARKF